MLSDSAPVFWLTVRQFLEGKSIRIIALLAAVPLLLGVIDLFATGPDVPVRSFLAGNFNNLTIPTILPLIALILSSTAFGNEISDRTLPYLTLKPWSRMRLIHEKFLATFGTGVTIAVAFVLLVWGMMGIARSEADGELLAAMLIASVLAIAGYAAVFTLLSLMISRVLMAGLLYVLIWEALLSGLIPGLRLLSIRHYAQSAFGNLLDDRSVSIAQQAATSTSVIVLGAVVAVSILLSWLRLQQMDLD